MKKLLLTLGIAALAACSNTPRAARAPTCRGAIAARLASVANVKLPACCADCTCVPTPERPAPHCPFC